MKIKHRIKVQGGKVIFANRQLFDREISSYEGQEAVLTIGKDTKHRSDNQNRYYHGVVVKILSDELGILGDEMHEILKDKFLGYNIELRGSEYRTAKSTASLNTKEFEDYLSQIRMWASSDMGIYIPEPNETDY